MYKSSRNNASHLPKNVKILYEDDDILVVDKPAGLLTIGTRSEKSKTLYFILTSYIRKGNAKTRKYLFIVHRLDREVSGVVVFAKNIAAKLYLQNHWAETKKKYLAIVNGKCTKHSDIIISYLAENKAHLVYSTADITKGKIARTAYKVLKTTRDLSLLEIDLLTGKKHQIRVHLADLGHPIVGDKKYGSGKRPQNHLALHAHSICFNHPVNHKPLFFETVVPEFFNVIIGSRKSEK